MSLGLPGIFLAGLLTFLSPCVLPLVPLYLSFLAGVSLSQLREAGSGVRRPWGVALAFSLGLGSVFVALGMAATAMGGLLAEHRSGLLQFGGLALFLLGLKQLGFIQIPWMDGEVRPLLGRVRRGGSLLGAFLFGAAFALGWTPCIGPVLGGVLTYTASSTSEPLMGALYLGTYAAGLSVPLLLVAAAAPLALRWMERAKRHLRKFEVATGVLLAGLGVLLFTDSLELLVPSAEGGEASAPVMERRASSSPAASETACTSEEGGDGTCALPEEGGVPSFIGPSALARVERPTMVEFVSQSCPVCQRMEPTVALAEQHCSGKGVEVLRLDVGTAAGRRAAVQYGVRGVPTFLFLDAAGQEVARRVGEQSLTSLWQGLEVIAGGRCAGLLP
ncbi:cytochrome c biogenesis protein/thioredoxin [Myxococcus xanthus DK 1622]|uniref:Cytochrome c biogenesis protein/thioredoxin n=1 Tax=Myxococcus xanthus (strain DK1622) TaxID=246197 RepID=Q1CZ86_MYXXD|nr:MULTISPECIES: cytochrome c biogenesis protein CcdA [Myxococcus]ABF90574.1 cytochrome c biogenesis protein/thioredoxin [Myxococcus xanthus DK 1622]NOJ54359.1 thioredoxin fold domain-containing protein [Myxococcus xanthus]QPM78544.1 thioredoxin fold domain-containing protein [Myxococcus xanthus]QVW67613.1 thioredoxin fold domain-containing protein [Myxococcus xanthus DZ2]QZZ53788.1 Thiol:disulfide interchange protein DsbD [Myxococcus xanthus]